MNAINNPHADLVTLAAHRGTHALAGTNQAPGVAENSLEAIGVAAQNGWESIEIDVKLTSDGIPVMSHDKVWGRELCLNAVPFGFFDPWHAAPVGSSVNPSVDKTPFSFLRSLANDAYLRDSVTIVNPTSSCTGPVNIKSPVVPTLQDVYDFIKSHNIQMVITLDIQGTDRASAAWTVVQKNTDNYGRPYSQTTMFKVPANLFPDVAAYQSVFPNSQYVNFNPVFHTSGIAPAGQCPTAVDVSDIEDVADDLGDPLQPGCPPSFGSEANMIQWLQNFASSPSVYLSAVEVSMKDAPPNGILSSLKSFTNSLTIGGRHISISSFNPVGEYISSTDSRPQFYSSANGSCCEVLDQFLFNNPNHIQDTNPQGAPYPGISQYDHNDNRTSVSFVVNSLGAQVVTTDLPDAVSSFLEARGLRNVSYMQGSPSVVDPHCNSGTGQYPGCDSSNTTLYTYCAEEGQTCSFAGGRNVAFGANGKYNTFYAINSAACNSTVLGPDPVVGVQKACYYGPAIMNLSAVQGVYCADEGGTCSYPFSTTSIRFGVDNKFDAITPTLAPYNLFCHSDAFSGGYDEGDPAVGYRKTCFYSSPAASGPAGYVQCAYENQPCTFAGTAKIAFGANGNFLFRTFGSSSPESANGGSACNRPEFGSDPAPGVAKSCYYQYAVPVSKNAGTTTTPSSGNTNLRLMPFGDSITWGYLSSDGNGYRGSLRNDLLGEFPAVDFVGSQIGGTMADPYNEGHPGYRIDQLAPLATSMVANWQPNVVTLMAGTNDMAQSYQLSTAPARLSAMIDQVVAASPSATVLVSDLIPSSDSTIEANIVNYNAQIPGIVQSKQTAGKKVQFVSMSAINVTDLSDSLHPNDGGYLKMANTWNTAILQASAGLQSPVSCSSIPAGCNDPAILGTPPPGNGFLPLHGNTPGPVGAVLGLADPTSLGQIASGTSAPSSSLVFADMDGDGKADYVIVDPTTGALTFYKNGGFITGSTVVNWQPGVTIATGGGVSGAYVRLADLNADGKADYIMINPTTGAFSAYINGGPSASAPNGWLWYQVGQIGTGTTINASNVQFADLDGDGRADYIVVNPNDGTATGYLNIGGDTSNGPGWLSLGQIASGVGAPPGTQVIFVDVNGDHRADYVYVNAETEVTSVVFNNGVSLNEQLWTAGGQLLSGDGFPIGSKQVQLADIVGDGKVEILVTPSGSHSPTSAFEVTGLQNHAASTYAGGWIPVSNVQSGLAGSSPVVFADVTGDGRADYIVINSNGSSTVYINCGQYAHGWCWEPPITTKAESYKSNAVATWADIDGDGLADFLTIDPATGAVNAWLNKGFILPSGSTLKSVGQIASGANPMNFTNPGYNVTFADIDGDGKADYVITDSVSGESYAYINGGFGSNGAIIWTPFGPPLTTVTGYTGWFFYADLNADGKADFLIDQNGGNVLAYLNGGKAGTVLNWLPQGQVATGITPYTNNQYVRFADLNGDGRADYIVLSSTNGAIPMAYVNNGGDTGTLEKQ